MNRRWWCMAMASIAVMALAGCASSEHYAPVSDISSIEPIPKNGMHQVKRGETLYEVAWRYGLDYRILAERNRVNEGQSLSTGRILKLQNNQRSPAPVKTKTRSDADNMSSLVVADWIKPAAGPIIRGFSGNNKGVNIGGVLGQPVWATADGKVVYCGNGLRAYGNLIIIKHNNLYLSAYAHNQSMNVREGQWVKQGQKIAAMGRTGTDHVMLHFEIRQAGKPVDPLSLLKLKPL